MQRILRQHVPGVAFGEPRVRFNPWRKRYHAIVLVLMPSTVPEDEVLDVYDDLMSEHVPDDLRNHLAVVVGRQGDV